jgi:hypothetical protein
VNARVTETTKEKAMNVNETHDTNRHGAYETNGLVNGAEYHEQVDYSSRMTLAEVAAAKGKITRVRLLSERMPGLKFYDVSYVHATLPDGRVVDVADVNVPNMCPAPDLMKHLIAWAKSERVFAKSIGLLDKSNWSEL